ncbi:MAG TPA: M20 family metallopeptidase [Candidatus Binataceae bacterium]|jgi:amidohydrolase|nr:M20 family metallopeptidase [Candidatus Binataceae bacterium]
MNAKDVARQTLERHRQALVDLSHRIHAHPELGFEEERACGWLCETLDGAGFAVERGICQLPTAFVARAGSGPLHVTICAEYDCLPAIGHACGHNMIAAMAAGAGIALAKAADDLGLSVTVLGTPAEEVGDSPGKVLLLERGAFDGTHFAMMVHPAPVDMAIPPFVALSQLDITYTGKEAHASAFPERGINAADALVVAQVALGLLRQHIRTTDRIHGIVTKGGDAPNVVPAHTTARYIVRARDLDEMEHIRERVQRCFEAGALATGARLEIVGGSKPYANLVSDEELAAIYQRNGEALGRFFLAPNADIGRAAGSTDMGNVSLVFPTIHPVIGISSLPAVNHQPEFAACCVTEAADRAVFDGALAMAWTAIDVAADAKLRARLMARARKH